MKWSGSKWMRERESGKKGEKVKPLQSKGWKNPISKWYFNRFKYDYIDVEYRATALWYAKCLEFVKLCDFTSHAIRATAADDSIHIFNSFIRKMYEIDMDGIVQIYIWITAIIECLRAIWLDRFFHNVSWLLILATQFSIEKNCSSYAR